MCVEDKGRGQVEVQFPSSLHSVQRNTTQHVDVLTCFVNARHSRYHLFTCLTSSSAVAGIHPHPTFACLVSSSFLSCPSRVPLPPSISLVAFLTPSVMTISLTPPPLDDFKDGSSLIKLEPKTVSTFAPIPHLSPTSTRKEIYSAIDSLSSFHSHHSHFHPAPEWDKLYACVRSYKKSHPDIPDIATAFQHHRRQVLGILREEERTPSVDRHRKRRDRQQQHEKAKRQQLATTAAVVPPLTADLSASVALSSFRQRAASQRSRAAGAAAALWWRPTGGCRRS